MHFGRIDSGLLLSGILAVALAGAVTDAARGRIYNWLTVPGMAGGVLASAWVHGWSGFDGALLAITLAFFLYGVIFLVGAMGAGDVKFLMALGAWSGTTGGRFVVDTALLAIALGGFLGLASLLVRGRFPAFARKVWRLVLSAALVSTDQSFEIETPAIDRSLTLPFGIPIALAAAWTAWGDPLFRWGYSLWPR